MADIGTTRVAQMATKPRWGLTEWPKWLTGQDRVYQNGQDVYIAKTEHDGNYQSGADGYMAKMGTTRVTQMTT